MYYEIKWFKQKVASYSPSGDDYEAIHLISFPLPGGPYVWPVLVRYCMPHRLRVAIPCPGIPFGSTLHLPGSAVPGVSICASIRSLQILPKGQLICCLDPYCLRYAKACWCLRDSAGRYRCMADLYKHSCDTYIVPHLSESKHAFKTVIYHHG